MIYVIIVVIIIIIYFFLKLKYTQLHTVTSANIKTIDHASFLLHFFYHPKM